MTIATSQAPETHLHSYRIASGDMRFIEVNTREIYLRQDSSLGLVLRGEIPGCGSICHADLFEIFLEYAMSCKGYEDMDVMLESIKQFGSYLGEKVVSIFMNQYPDWDEGDILAAIIDCLLVTTNSGQSVERAESEIIVTFTESPLLRKARDSNLHLYIPPAYEGIIALIQNILRTVGGGWVLATPQMGDSEHDLQVIRMTITP